MESLIIAVYVAGMVMLAEAIVKVVRIGLRKWSAEEFRESMARLSLILLAILIVMMLLGVDWTGRAPILAIMALFIGAIIKSFFPKRPISHPVNRSSR